MHARAPARDPAVSVALCTCNGARFLTEQLESIARQSLPPAELVVCDDASDDDTVAQVEVFSRGAPFPVRVERNPDRLGPAANFARAVGLCGKDLIALADQDDVWYPDRLAAAAERFQAEPDLGATFSDAGVVDERLQPLGYTVWQHVGFTAREREAVDRGGALEVLLKHYIVTGATMTFRANLRPLLLPMPGGWYHDAWLATVTAAVSRVAAIPRALMRYRQHGANVIGGQFEGYVPQAVAGVRLGRDAYYRQEVGRLERLREHLQGLGNERVRAGALDLVEAKLNHLRARAALPRNRLSRLPGVLNQLARGGYARFAKDWRSVAMDVFFP